MFLRLTGQLDIGQLDIKPYFYVNGHKMMEDYNYYIILYSNIYNIYIIYITDIRFEIVSCQF